MFINDTNTARQGLLSYSYYGCTYLCRADQTEIKLNTLVKSIQESRYRFPFSTPDKHVYIHLAKNEQHLLLDILFQRIADKKFLISNAKILSYFDVVNTMRDAPQSEELFQTGLKKLPQVEEKTEQLTPIIHTSISSPAIPDRLELTNLTCHLSYETQRGLMGRRGADHCMPLTILQACLEAKQNKLRKQITQPSEKLSFYFKKKSVTVGGQLLNVVINKYKNNSSSPKAVVVTAYYLSYSTYNYRIQSEPAEITTLDCEIS